MLAELTLPPGSGESSTNPAEGGSALASPGFGPPATPNAVDDHAWWVVPLTPTETVAYIYAHLPPCTTRPTSISARTVFGFTWPGNLGTLVVWAVRLADGSTALRVDAQVVWIVPRPASARIPSGAHLLTISVHEAGNKNIRITPERATVLRRLPSHVTSTAQIDKVIALLDELRVHQPGIRHCPVAPAWSVQLTFYTSPSAPPLAIADIHNDGGCGGVSLRIHGIGQPGLEEGWYLVEEISRLLQIRSASARPKPHR